MRDYAIKVHLTGAIECITIPQMNLLADLHNWDKSSSAQKYASCAGVAEQFQKISFHDLERFSFGDNCHDIGVFKFEEERFLLIPGGKVSLGFDPDTSQFPSDEWRAAWRTQYEEFPPLDEELIRCMIPHHTVTLNAFLIEAESRVPEVSQPDCPFHDEVELLLDGTQWRLPTRDEWEYAYRGGSHSFFPWGNDPYPDLDISSPTNAFGFVFPQSSYYWEFVRNPRIMVGGDGGCTQCGGWGPLAESIIDACAYYNLLETEPWFGHYRRCCTVQIHV